jgi:hypothetical protein
LNDFAGFDLVPCVTERRKKSILTGRFDFAHAPFPQYAQLAAALELTPFAFRWRSRWKRGIIASEPYLEIPQSKNRIVIDSTTRSGMSGSPVILRQKTHYISESGEIKQYANASRLLGVYSSRPKFSPTSSAIDGLEDARAELGYVYKSGLIEQIIREGIPGPDYGHLP